MALQAILDKRVYQESPDRQVRPALPVVLDLSVMPEVRVPLEHLDWRELQELLERVVSRDLQVLQVLQAPLATLEVLELTEMLAHLVHLGQPDQWDRLDLRVLPVSLVLQVNLEVRARLDLRVLQVLRDHQDHKVQLVIQEHRVLTEVLALQD